MGLSLLSVVANLMVINSLRWSWWRSWTVVDGDGDHDCVVEGDSGGDGEPGSFVDGDGGSDSDSDGVVDGDHNGPGQSHGESDSDLVDAQGEGGIAGGEAEPGEQITISES